MIIALLSKNAKELWRDKKLFLLTLFSPVFLLLLSHLFYQQTLSNLENIPLDVVNPEIKFPEVGKLLVMGLSRVPSPHKTANSSHPLFAIKEVSREQALEDMRQGKTTAALIIPSRLTQNLNENKPEKLLLLLSGAHWQSAVITSALQTYTEKFGFLIEKSKGRLPEEPLTLSMASLENAPPTAELQAFVDVALLAFLFLIPYVAGQWIGEIETGTLLRFRLARTPRALLLGGTVITTVSLALTQVALLLLSARFLGLTPDALSLWIWPVAVILAVAAYGLGILLAGFVEKEKQLNLLAAFFLIPLYFFSGPAGEGTLSFKMANALPWRHGYEILSQTLLREQPSHSHFLFMLIEALMLCFIGSVFFSMKRLSHD